MKIRKLFGGMLIMASLLCVALLVFSGKDKDEVNGANEVNGHEYVDLGLSVKWATCNVGATAPEGYGDYFAWGETSPKSDYSWSTLKYYNDTTGNSISFSKYNQNQDGTIDNKTTLDLRDDAARANWGGSWRMPTRAEQDELIEKCTWTWTTMNGVEGYKVVSKSNGNSIFLPAAGFRDGSSLLSAGSGGICWSSSLSAGSSYYACSLVFSSDDVGWDDCDRCYGLSVRPVCPVPVTSISLDKQSVEIMQGGTETLTATVKYENGATGNTATWSSSNASVATVDQTGKVRALSVGTCTITAAIGSFSATCAVTVKPDSHQFVDLGLSVKWGTCNVGASKPEEYGDYFAWGETTSKNNYSWSNLKYCLDSNGDKFSKYVSSSRSKYVSSSSYGTVDNRETLELSDDAARANWGGSWRMPTFSEIMELWYKCTWTWTTQNGVTGYKVTSEKVGYTDKSIFLPAAGYRSNGNLNNAGSRGYYWSSTLNKSSNDEAYGFCFYPDSRRMDYDFRALGRTVRPVCPSDNFVFVTSVSLNTSSVSLEVGCTTTLTATISPSNATDKSVQWSSSNTDVATVDKQGNVTAKSAGTAVITVTTTDENITATCTVIVKYNQIVDGKENGHEYVDLGLSVKWANCNVGASKPEEYGSYFAWGETTSKSTYNWSTYKYCNGSSSTMTKYCTSSSDGTVDNKTTLELSDDAARANWGGSWRMPTVTEFDELINNCTWTWTILNGVKGCKVTSNKSGYTDKSIFLPAAGRRYDGNLGGAGSDGDYWFSSLYTSDSSSAYRLEFYSGYHHRDSDYRFSGQSVRPVCP